MMSLQPRFCLSSVFLLALTLILLTVSYFAFDLPLRVNEKACRLRFEEAQPIALLALENRAGGPLAASVKIELLDLQSRSQAYSTQELLISGGTSTISFNLTSVNNKVVSNEKLWWRLRYIITPQDTSITPLEGLISISEITPDIFDLQVLAARNAEAGMRYQARARTVHPITGRPVSGVNISALASYERNDKEQEIKASAITNQDGYAIVTFDLPKDFSEDEDPEISIAFTALKGSLVCKEELDLNLLQVDSYIVSTDKSLYQPGQTIHARVVIFDQQKRARGDYETEAVIEDADNQKVFRTKLKTSKFGVAAFAWKVPDNTKLGGYRIIIGNPTPARNFGEAQVKVSRYDLPAFVTKVKPGKSYYLPKENAVVEVNADYLFGQPVTQGTVKIVREAERSWNYKTHKYDIEQGESWRGETNASGKFIAHIDLSKLHAEFEPSDNRKFEDIHFAAYFTDATTGRTEQRKFDLRITKDPIHLYLIKDYQYAANQPPDCFVNASYADGTPAQCDVTIYQKVENEDTGKEEENLLTRVSTNKYGLAKVTGLRHSKQSGDETYDPELIVRALDSQGKTGLLETELTIVDEPILKLTTSKSLYHAGEPINAALTASFPTARVVLEVLHNNSIVHSQMLDLKQHNTSVVIPHQPAWRDEVTLVAYANVEDGEQTKFVNAFRTVLYPRDRELKLAVKMARTDFQPGEEAQAEMLVKTADGKPINSALGISIVDTAVHERQRTDNEFSGARNYLDYYYGSANIAGFSRRDLDKLDTKQPISAAMDLVAEVLLRDSSDSRLIQSHESSYSRDARWLFSSYLDVQFRPIKELLEREYNSTGVYPKDSTTLSNLLRRIGIDPEAMRDPWGKPYHIGFLTLHSNDRMAFLSAGPDKNFDTDDDFIALDISRRYFKFTGEAINRAVASYQARKGDYISNGASLISELKREGLDFEALRDPWGSPYHIHLRKNYSQFSLVVRSAGPDQKLEIEKLYGADDVIVWEAKLDFFSDLRHRIDKALSDFQKRTNSYPQDAARFREALQQGGIDFDALRDPLGHRYYAVIISQAYYADRSETITYVKHGAKPQELTSIVPLTRTIIRIELRGVGEDDQEGTRDDYNVTSLAQILSEQASTDRKTTPQAESRERAGKPISGSLLPPGSAGLITGTITDPAGAVVPNASITAKSRTSEAEYGTRTNEEGLYFLRGLPPGLYDVSIEALGFKKYVVGEVLVVAARTIVIDASISVGATTEAVMISADTQTLQTTSASVSSVVVNQLETLPINGRNVLALSRLTPGAVQQPLSTPRLREYFPETMFWQPNLETDRQGRAQVKFKFADNITTWKLAVIGTTVDGQIGTVEKELRAFQPFFAELDPPKVLTAGDELSLPVVLRNYLDKPQTVALQFKPEAWFKMLGPSHKQCVVKPNDATKELFEFLAIASIKDGKQRVTAIGTTNSDAIEKSVHVHPDGEELASTTGNVFGAAGVLDINVPEDAIQGSAQAELKIYPNLLAHVTEGIEGILQRPYGCGEQTISSTYPNVMALRLLKSTEQGEAARSAVIAVKARKYAQAGYDRLLGYRDASGGFKYWSGDNNADLALTAYALRFLHDASEVIAIRREIIDEAQAWLLKQQSTDGHWSVKDYYGKLDARRSAMYTSLIARSLTAGGSLSKEDNKALQKALEYLTPKLIETGEPYALANFAIAARQIGDQERANWAVAKLQKLSQEESGGVYWALETNTPFYGWGLAGRIETTALVLKALNQTTGDTGSTGQKNDNEKSDTNNIPLVSAQSSPVSPALPVGDSSELISKGVFWLLRNKDRYGVWLSTQATINVLDAFVALSDRTMASGESSAEVLLNGQRITTVTLPASQQLSNPLIVNLTQHLTTGNNRIEIKRASNAALATAQVVATHYLPWAKSLATQSENLKTGASRALRLAVNYDKPEAKIGEAIVCRVEAERIGFAGYGMLLAEIGLPPGAEVDRASLELAVKTAGYEINHYDVLPDRVIFYLWPRAGGCKFSFKFRSRFGTKALSAASILYDYYNPEARAVVAPTRFVVQ